MAAHGVDGSLLLFAVSLLIGGFAIHTGARIAFASREYADAVLTALIGAIVWTLVDVALSRIGAGGLVASIIGLIAWIYVIRLIYHVGWIRATVVGVGAWLSAVLVLTLLAVVGIGDLRAIGVPGL